MIIIICDDDNIDNSNNIIIIIIILVLSHAPSPCTSLKKWNKFTSCSHKRADLMIELYSPLPSIRDPMPSACAESYRHVLDLHMQVGYTLPHEPLHKYFKIYSPPLYLLE